MEFKTRNIAAVLLLWGAGLLAAGQFAKIAVPFSEYEIAYAHVGDNVGWLLSLISFMGAALGVAAGGLVGRIGAKRVLFFALALGSATSLFQASMPSFPVFLLSRLIEGVSHLSIVVAAPTLIVQITPVSWRARAMVLWSTHFAAAFALVAWFGLPLVSSYGIENLLIAHSAILLVTLTILAAVLPNTGNAPQPSGSFGLSQFIRSHTTAYSSRSISGPGIGWISYTITFVALLAILPSRFSSDFSDGLSGALPIVSIISSLFIVPLLLRKSGAVSVVIYGFFAAMIAISFTAVDLHISMITIGLYAGLGLVQGATFAAVPELNSEIADQALGYGVITQTGNLGNLIGAPLLLFVLDHLGETGLLTVVFCLYAAAAFMHLSLKRSLPVRPVQ